jgi:hypothetical protein
MSSPQPADPPSAHHVYLQSLLETPGRILAEDAEHVVLAVRLPKALLREDVPLLMALAEAAVAPAREN